MQRLLHPPVAPERARNEAWAHWPSCSQGLPSIYSRDGQGLLHLPRDIQLWGKRGRTRRYRCQGSKGTLQGPRAIQFMVSPRQPRSRKQSREKGWEEGELGRHSSSCNFRTCGHICVLSSEKYPTPGPHHAPATVCVTQSSRTLQKPKVLLHPFGEEEG